MSLDDATLRARSAGAHAPEDTVSRARMSSVREAGLYHRSLAPQVVL